MFKETKRKGFNFFRSYYDVYNELESDKDKLAFIEALLDRQFLGVKPDNLKGMAKFAYISQTNSIDGQVKGYEHKTKTTLFQPVATPCQGGSEGGSEAPCQQEKEKEKEKEESTIKEKSFSDKKKDLLVWFNHQKKIHTGTAGKFKTLSKTDENNFKQLLKDYDQEDFRNAIPNLFKNKWAIETNNLTPSHFLRVDNFNKYLNTTKPKKDEFENGY